MPQILANDFQGIFTNAFIDVYSDFLPPTSFFRSFFPADETMSRYLSIMVERNTEPIAVDVLRGTPGNRNNFATATQKTLEPPYWREYFDATELSFYDRVWSQSQVDFNGKTFDAWVREIAEKLAKLQAKIERTIELNCAQVLQTGIVVLQANTNIDFKRRGTSKVVLGAGDRWNETTSDPIGDIITACDFIRQQGKSQGGDFNLICGSSAWEAFVQNQIVKDRADIRRFDLVNVREPQRNAAGGSLLGRITAGSYNLNCWGYSEFYDDAAGVSQPYLNPKMVVILPEMPRFKTGFAAVPMIFRDRENAEMPEYIRDVAGQFHIGNYIDQKAMAHVYDIKSAACPIPVAVDQIYTLTVLA